MVVVLSKPMQKIYDELTTRGLAETTAKTYLRVLNNINGGPFSSLTFLKNVDKVMESLSKLQENTKKSYLGGILSVLLPYESKASYKPTVKKYKKIMEELQGKLMQVDTSVKTEKQKAAWIDWKDVEAKKNELKAKVDVFAKKRNLQGNQFEALLDFLVLSLYTDTPPRRNKDYQQMVVVKEWNESMSADKNYVDVKNKKFIFNQYKTVSHGGQQIIDIPETLMQTINLYLKHHKQFKKEAEPWFLTNFMGGHINATNGITRILNKIFGVKIGPTMLRHIYLSDKYDIKEMTDDAKAMAHSVGMQKQYMKQKDEPTVE